MIYKMTYTNKVINETLEVDVYNFITDFETMECYALCWSTEKQYWMTVPVYMLTPRETTKKKILKEGTV